MSHKHFMRHCLGLAAQGRGLVGSNPLVGACIVRGEEIIAEGFYKGSGTSHAEVAALSTLKSIQENDVLYVNLEPCNHHGETPPCSEAIIAAGIKTVVYGMQDPDLRVAGQGIARLQEAGVLVIGPVCRAECERLNRGYISLRTKHRPYITLKKAQTLDGRVANDDGSKLCITTDEQNTWSHKNLRATHDAILVGVQTVITDNPQLTTRRAKSKEQRAKQITPIILDPHLRIPIDANVVREGTVVVTSKEQRAKSKEQRLIAKGCTILECSEDMHGFNLEQLCFLLSAFCSSILVEGGPKTWQAFEEAGLIDEEIILTN